MLQCAYHFSLGEKMIAFHSDLDNTLIYSYKKEIGPKKKCVEHYQGREISFMTEESYYLLREISSRVMVIPTTTRTKEQYERIELGIEIPKYALVCNGGVLLEHGKSSKVWYQESLEIISESKGELNAAVKLLEQDEHRCFEIRLINELFVFTKSDRPQETISYLKTSLNTHVVDIFHNGSKIYVVPKKLTKGNAVKRLKKILNPEKIIAAGDSEFDISMFSEADIAWMPKELSERYLHRRGTTLVHDKKSMFSDMVLNYISEKLL